MWGNYNVDKNDPVYYDSREPIIYDVVNDTLPEYKNPKNSTVKKGFFDTLGNEIKDTFSFIDDVFQGLGNGLKTMSKNSSLIVFVLIAVGITYVYKGFKWKQV